MFCLHRLLKVFVLLKHNTHYAPRSMFKQGIYPALAVLFAATLMLGGMGIWSEPALASPLHASGLSVHHTSQRYLLQVQTSVPLVLPLPSDPAVALNGVGALEVFVVGKGGDMQHIYQTCRGCGWSAWHSLGYPSTGGNFESSPTVALNGVGALEVFATGASGDMQHIYQTNCNPNCTGWSNWSSLGKPSTGGRFPEGSTPAVALNGASNRALEVFGLGSNGDMQHIYQTNCNPGCHGWSNWGSLGKPSTGGTFISDAAVALNGAGVLEVFDLGSNGDMQHIYQTCRGCGWSIWHSLGFPSTGGTFVSDAAVALNGASNPALEVFAIASNGNMQHIYQTNCNPNCTGWSNWGSLGFPTSGGTFIRGPAVALNGVGVLEVFAGGSVGDMQHIYQTCRGCGWSNWSSLGKPSTGGDFFGTDPAVALNGASNPALEVFAVASSDDIQHIYQTNCNPGCHGWSNWGSFGVPG